MIAGRGRLPAAVAALCLVQFMDVLGRHGRGDVPAGHAGQPAPTQSASTLIATG
jgi:hypothetical protein